MHKTLDHVSVWETPKVAILATSKTLAKTADPTESAGAANNPNFGAS